MSRRRPQPIEEPDKSMDEMTSKERAAYLTRLRRAVRDDQVRRGARRPKTMREAEIWHEALAERDERRARRIARAERGVPETDTGPTQE